MSGVLSDHSHNTINIGNVRGSLQHTFEPQPNTPADMPLPSIPAHTQTPHTLSGDHLSGPAPCFPGLGRFPCHNTIAICWASVATRPSQGLIL